MGWLTVPILFDSGADVSVISLECIDTSNIRTNSYIAGIGGKQTVGEAADYKIRFSCDLGTLYNVQLRHLKLQSDMIILGRDFLSTFNVTTFDWKNHRIQLGDVKWIYLSQHVQQDPPQPTINISRDLNMEELQQVRTVTLAYPNVFAHNPKAPRECGKASHVIQSRDDRVCFSKVNRIPNKWKNDIDKQIEEMLQNNIIRHSKSAFNSNPILVDKKDSTKRFVIDFRNLNDNTVPDSYPLPNVDDLVDQCHGCIYFSQLDLACGYWGIPVAEGDRYKTAFSVPRGKFEFIRMPFGLINAQATFQRCMDCVVEEVKRRGGVGIDA
jgi:hypothetical protein